MKSKILVLIIIFMCLISTIVFGEDSADIYSLKINHETEAVLIDLEIPVIRKLENEEVRQNLNQMIQNNIFSRAERIEADAEELRQEAERFSYPFNKFEFFVDFELKNKGDIISIVLDLYQFTGGAHGLGEKLSYNIDGVSGKILTLDEVLARTDLTFEEIKGEVIEKIRMEPEEYYNDAEEVVRNKESFNYYLEEEYLVIYFQRYEISAYVFGIPEFRIRK